jgi:hypothetical protein
MSAWTKRGRTLLSFALPLAISITASSMSMPTTSLAPRTAEYTAKPPVLQHRSSTRLPATCCESHWRFSRWSAKKAGLVRARGIGAEAHAELGDDRGLRRFGAAVVERLLLLHVLVGRGVEAAAGELRAQRLVDPFAIAERAGAEELDH